MNAKFNPNQIKKSSWWLTALITMTFVLAACAPAAAPSPQAAAPTSPPATEPQATEPPAASTQALIEASIKVASDAKLGSILVDGAGMTLYMFTKDEPDKVNCAGKCLENWPPLLTQGNPSLGDGVDPALVGTAPMADGTLIVTYNHMPLYYWIKDKQPGDTTGQGNNDVWYVVSPDGNPVGYTNANANSNTNSNDNANENSDDNSNDNSNENSDDNSNDNGGG